MNLRTPQEERGLELCDQRAKTLQQIAALELTLQQIAALELRLVALRQRCDELTDEIMKGATA